MEAAAAVADVPTPTACRRVEVTRVEHAQPVTFTGNCHDLTGIREHDH